MHFVSQTSASKFNSQQDALQICSSIIQQIIIQRHGCSVLHIKVQRHTSAEWLIPENINMLLSFCLACVYGLQRERMIKRGKHSPCFIFNCLQLNHFVGQCTCTLKCIQISPVNRPLKSNTQRCFFSCLVAPTYIWALLTLVPAL